MSKLDPNSTSTFCESEILRLSYFLDDFSVVKDLPLNNNERDLAEINSKEALELFIERTEFEKSIKSAKINGLNISKHHDLLSKVRSEASKFLENKAKRGKKKEVV